METSLDFRRSFKPVCCLKFAMTDNVPVACGKMERLNAGNS